MKEDFSASEAEPGQICPLHVRGFFLPFIFSAEAQYKKPLSYLKSINSRKKKDNGQFWSVDISPLGKQSRLSLLVGLVWGFAG